MSAQALQAIRGATGLGLIALRYTYPGMSCFSSHNRQGQTPLPNGAFGNCHNQSEWAILDWIVRPGLNRATDRMMVSLARLLACLFRSYSRRNNLEHWRNHLDHSIVNNVQP